MKTLILTLALALIASSCFASEMFCPIDASKSQYNRGLDLKIDMNADFSIGTVTAIASGNDPRTDLGEFSDIWTLSKPAQTKNDLVVMSLQNSSSTVTAIYNSKTKSVSFFNLKGKTITYGAGDPYGEVVPTYNCR